MNVRPSFTVQALQLAPNYHLLIFLLTNQSPFDLSVEDAIKLNRLDKSLVILKKKTFCEINLQGICFHIIGRWHHLRCLWPRLDNAQNIGCPPNQLGRKYHLSLIIKARPYFMLSRLEGSSDQKKNSLVTIREQSQKVLKFTCCQVRYLSTARNSIV